MTISQKSLQIKKLTIRNRFSCLNFKSERFLFVLLFLFSIFAGATWPAGKVIAQSLSPIGAAFYRYSVALPLFITISIVNQKTQNEGLIFGKSEVSKLRLHLQLAILGFLGVALYTVLFLEGVKHTSASDATMIFAITPTITVIIANYIIPDEKISLNKLIGFLFALSGVAIIFFESPNKDVPNRILGNLFIFISAIVMAVHTVFSKPVFKKINVIDFSTWIIFYGWIFLLIPVLIQSPEYFQLDFIKDLKFTVVLSIIYLAVFIVYATIIFGYGVKQIGPARTAIFMNLIPIFGVLFSILLIEEVFSFWYIPAFATIMYGVYQVNKLH